MRIADSVPALAFLAAVGGVAFAAEDALYSRRLAKRDIDADGNFNICERLTVPEVPSLEGLSRTEANVLSLLPH